MVATKYSSPSVNHILSYSIVSYISNVVLQYQVANYLKVQLESISTYIFDLISKYPVVIDNLKFVDAKFETSFLSTFDYILSLPIDYYTLLKKNYDEVFDKFNKYYFDTINYYLGISSATYSFEGNKIGQFVKISNYGLINVKDVISLHYNKLSTYLISSANKEIESNSNNVASYPKIAYNLIFKFYQDFNENYFTPIKIQTTDYVQDVANQTKSKADLYVKNLNFIPKQAEEIEVPVVSASA